jgi:hypothetical protein
MPTINILHTSKPQKTKAVLKTTPSGRLIVEKELLPHAGKGACRVAGCSCKQYVPETAYKPLSVTAHQPHPCGNCGHDEKTHG